MSAGTSQERDTRISTVISLARPRRLKGGIHCQRLPAFAATLGRWGIGPDDTVVAYDDANGAIAARLWWMLGWIGHRGKALVLDGGFPAWQAAGLPVEAALPDRNAENLSALLAQRERLWSTRPKFLRGSGRATWSSTRAPPRVIAASRSLSIPVAGHVPGSHNWPFSNNTRGRCVPPSGRAAQ